VKREKINVFLRSSLEALTSFGDGGRSREAFASTTGDRLQGQLHH
jgi:hypothetical protein